MTPSATQLQIGPMAGRHIEAVGEIDALCYSSPWSGATWRNELSRDAHTHLVATDGSTVVGHAGLLRVLDEAHITTVAVHPHRQGEGIASRLLLFLIEVAIEAGVEAATLEVRAAAHRTQRLYARFGFSPAGVRHRYYTDPSDDAMVMWLHELQGAEAADRLTELSVELSGSFARGEAAR